MLRPLGVEDADVEFVLEDARHFLVLRHRALVQVLLALEVAELDDLALAGWVLISPKVGLLTLAVSPTRVLGEGTYVQRRCPTNT